MKRIRYYLKFNWFCSFEHDWPDVRLEAKVSDGILLYKTEDNEIYCYELPTHAICGIPWSVDREEEVEISKKPIKLESIEPIHVNWKSRNRGANGGNVRLNPMPGGATKLYNNRYYKKIKEDGFNRLNKPKKSPPKGEVFQIYDNNLKMKETKWTAQILLQSNRLTRVEFFSPSNLREDAEATVKALYNVTDVRQLRRLWN